MSAGNTQPIHREHVNIPANDLAVARPRDATTLCACEMDVESGPAGDIIVLRVAGEIDMLTIATVREALVEAMDRRPADIVLDLTALGFCCVRGFALIATTVCAAQSRGIGFAVSGMNPHQDRVANMLWREEDCVRYRTVAVAVTAIRIDQTYRSA